MSMSARISFIGLIGSLVCSQVACNNLVPRTALRQSQIQAHQLAANNQSLNQTAQSLAAEKQQLEHRTSALQSSLDVANRRIANVNNERTELQNRYVGLLNRARDQKSPLSPDATRRFEALADQYPDFEFDPQTGVSKFHSDILYASGSAQINPSAEPILREFAKIMNQNDAKRLNILVVGHTDDKPISRRATRAKHPTNWHLSTNRANSVLLALAKHGINQSRMGAAGYSMFQPVVPNKNDQARKTNRRVEIFVLAPDAIVAGWDPATSRK